MTAQMAVESCPSVPRRVTRELLASASGTRRGRVIAAEDGVVAGLGLLEPGDSADPAGLWTTMCDEGDELAIGEPLIEVVGSAWELAVAEDHVMGVVGFASGVARRALGIRAAAPPGLRVVCGGWKKLPVALKPALRAGLDVAGIGHRLVDGEFVYIDKNVVVQLGGIEAAVAAGIGLQHGPVAVQVIDVDGARRAIDAGCSIVMVDNGDLATLGAVVDVAATMSVTVKVAYAGGVTVDDLAQVAAEGAAIVDVGRAALDAPLWDLRFVVTPPSRSLLG